MNGCSTFARARPQALQCPDLPLLPFALHRLDHQQLLRDQERGIEVVQLLALRHTGVAAGAEHHIFIAMQQLVRMSHVRHVRRSAFYVVDEAGS